MYGGLSLCKRRGFVYPSSEIYGGLSGFWDFGPLGVELKNNLKHEWWKNMVWERGDASPATPAASAGGRVVGLDSAIIYNSKVWEKSGHTKNFSDPLIECKKCHSRFRAEPHAANGERLTACPSCSGKEFTEPKQFNLMFKTYVGPVESEEGIAYLRPETAQGIFINFENIINTTRLKLPFGIAQLGKAFRNEITTGNFIFRSREFEQAELEWFCRPEEADKWFKYWQKERISWYGELGMKKENIKFREHEDKERAHYAVTAFDIEYQFPWGWGELEGIANRSDYDLKAHGLKYKDEESGEELVPFVVEPSVGIERSAFAFLLDAYHEEPGAKSQESRVVLKLHPKLAPYKVAVFPLVANKPDLVKKAQEVFKLLTHDSQLLPVAWDDRGNIGKRYYSQDEIGTPWCVTVDYQTLEDQTVTVRDRDTTKQERIKISELSSHFLSSLQ
ncbi:glycine--tRNA ligase [candidate division WWE3 bacterium RIFCSPLOWO2_02_FULL_53_10]|uniref:Glycine--tRNA ligase n=1 Tax=candidate division WWE3 bacterium RIFCSPLOWO2_02_FULL_53_10 TaxID=1802629 RepID=A0A1F4WKG5_UNCKA|nr:MAG: glycine--tRNA ligase [candidate division WWE3 bacterium RIFCSPLOWO2_02_FULL_53_10]